MKLVLSYFTEQITASPEDKQDHLFFSPQTLTAISESLVNLQSQGLESRGQSTGRASVHVSLRKAAANRQTQSSQPWGLYSGTCTQVAYIIRLKGGTLDYISAPMLKNNFIK